MEDLERYNPEHPDYDELQQLIEQLRNGMNEEANAVIVELREKGWLLDGSLLTANLSHADLKNAALYFAVLSGANLSGAVLFGAVLTQAILSHANLSRADLRNATLPVTDLSHADLSRAVMFGADLNSADLSHADLSHADLGRTQLHHANLSHANLTYANLSAASLSDTDLSAANLSSADLYFASLYRANLRGADLTEAIMSGTDLSEADLSGADLSRAILSGANLHGARLRGVSLQGAYLKHANLSHVDLSGADLRGAFLSGTVFGNVDLAGTKGLEAVNHLGPSIVDLQTLEYVYGQLPVNFLQGVGFSDTFIKSLPSLFGGTTQFEFAFISYSVADSDFARYLNDNLQGRGIRCWLAEHNLEPGEVIVERASEVVRMYDRVILICSENSLTSWWVEDEIEKTLEMERVFHNNTGKRILKLIPVRLDDYVLDEEKFNVGNAQEIRKRLVADFKAWKDHDAFEVAVKKLIPALRTKRKPDPEPKLGRENK